MRLPLREYSRCTQVDVPSFPAGQRGVVRAKTPSIAGLTAIACPLTCVCRGSSGFVGSEVLGQTLPIQALLKWFTPESFVFCKVHRSVTAP